MPAWFDSFKAAASAKLARFNNATFRDASMAVCALMAAADGSIDPAERKKTADVITSSSLLAAFDAGELGRSFSGFCDLAGDDIKRLDLITKVRALKGNTEQADLAMRIGLIIANADGNFDEKEKAVARELCGVLGLDPAAYLS